MRISDWSSDVCSSDLSSSVSSSSSPQIMSPHGVEINARTACVNCPVGTVFAATSSPDVRVRTDHARFLGPCDRRVAARAWLQRAGAVRGGRARLRGDDNARRPVPGARQDPAPRCAEPTSVLQSLMRTWYTVLLLTHK